MARILVIDDDASLRGLVRSVLEGQGYEVVEATNGAEGLACYGVAPADVVITDMQMPVMDGLQVILALRRTCAPAPIIAISGGVNTLDLVRPLTQRTFEKPFQLRSLLAAVHELVCPPTPCGA
jgi:CheY-like chemotaxis protein